MGMFSEIDAGVTAEKLEKIILLAIAKSGDVKEFAKDHLYDWYLYECGDSYGIHNANSLLKREFEETKSQDFDMDID